MKKITSLFLLIFVLMLFPVSIVYADVGSIVGPDVVYKQADKILTTNNILSLYSSSDGEIVVIDNQFIGHGNVVGDYPITIGVEGTEYEKVITIKVQETLGDVIVVADQNEIYVHKNILLTSEQIVEVLVKTAYIEITASTQVTLLSNEYGGNEAIPNVYIFEFRIENTAGFEAEYTARIHVQDSEYLDPSIILHPEPGWLGKVWNWIKAIRIPWDTIFFGFLSIALFIIAIILLKKQRKWKK